MERGAKVSGSRFAYRLGDAALLELALYRFALDRLDAQGLHARCCRRCSSARRRCTAPASSRPTRSTSTRIERDDLYLTGTSEVAARRHAHGREARRGRAPAPVRGLLDLLPPRGRRRRQGHARHVPRAPVRQGRDVRLLPARGLAPRSTSACSRSRRSSSQELGLPYRVVNVAAGDLGASAAKKYDIEAWFPGQERYREITSTSNTTDFQARRLGTRYRTRRRSLEPVHTLNGTAVTARVLLAIMENFQDAGGRGDAGRAEGVGAREPGRPILAAAQNPRVRRFVGAHGCSSARRASSRARTWTIASPCSGG